MVAPVFTTLAFCPVGLSCLGVDDQKADSSIDLGTVLPSRWGRRMKEKDSGVCWGQFYPGWGEKFI